MEYDVTRNVVRTFDRPGSTADVPVEIRASTSDPWAPQPVHNSGSGSSPSVSYPETRRYVGDREWDKKVKMRQFVANPYLRVSESFDYGHMSLETQPHIKSWSTLQRYNGIVRMQGPVIGDSPFAPASLPASNTNFGNALKIEATADAKAGALQMLVSMLEGPKSLALFTSLAGNLAQVLHAARRRLNGSKKEVGLLLDRMEVHGLQDGVSAYLQWRYGWRILLMEIETAFRVLANNQSYIADLLHRDRANGELPALSTVSGTSWHNWPSKHYCAPGPMQASVYYRYKKNSVKVRGSAVVYYKITEEAYKAKQLSLSFAPTLWELIPYSFVADWFVNVSDWLTAYASSVPGMTFEGGVYSMLELTETIYEPTHGHYGSPTAPFTVSSFKPARHEKMRFTRTLFNPAQPILPVVSDGLTFMRALDAVALVTQRMNFLTRDAASWRFKLPRKT